jgi:hypothetical protein
MLPRSFHVSQIAFGIPRIECSEIAQVTRFSTILSSAERLHSITTAEIKEIFFETLKTKDIVLTDAAAEEIQTYEFACRSFRFQFITHHPAFMNPWQVM